VLPIEPDQLLRELQDTQAILTKWVARIEKDGIPVIDRPGADEALEEFISHLAGELLLVAGRAETLSGVLIGPR
jgi:hypothetical protein